MLETICKYARIAVIIELVAYTEESKPVHGNIVEPCTVPGEFWFKRGARLITGALVL